MTAAGDLRRASGQVAVVTAIARAVGFLRWFAFAWAVGATGVGTVYQSVNAVPNLVYEIVAGGVLAAVVVPLVAAARRTGHRRRGVEKCAHASDPSFPWPWRSR